LAVWGATETYRTADWTPATTRAVVQAMQAAAPYVSRLAGFSFVHYLSRYGWFPAYAAPYLHYARTGALPSYRPTAPVISLHRAGLDVRLGWAAVVDRPTSGYLPAISHYRVYRGEDGGTPRLLATVRASRTGGDCGAAYCVDDPQLVPGHTYAYTVIAANAVGNTARSTVEVRVPALTGADDLALGARYRVSPAPSARYPDEDGNLVDGQIGAVDDQDPAWAGWTDPAVTFTVDLGSVQPITSVGSTWLQQLGPSVVLPTKVTVAASRDGRSWTAVGTARRPRVGTANQVSGFVVPIADAVWARYVRLTAVNPGGWLFAAEITVRGPHPLAGRTGIVVSRPPAASYPGTVGGLQDGVVGRAGDPYDAQWAGWWRADGLSLTVPLAEVRTVHSVTLHCLSLTGWGIQLPAGARVEVSADGIDYHRVGIDLARGTGTVTLTLDEPVPVRYLRVIVSTAPDTWTMISEVTVR
jgi:hypothetical protein